MKMHVPLVIKHRTRTMARGGRRRGGGGGERKKKKEEEEAKKKTTIMRRRKRGVGGGCFVGWLLNVPATCECISGTVWVGEEDEEGEERGLFVCLLVA